MTASTRTARSFARLPLRRLYPLVGALLAIVAWLTFSAAHAGKLDPRASLEAAASVAAGDAPLALLFAIVLVTLGRAIGRKEDALEASACSDAGTNLPNRRCYEASAQSEVACALRCKKELALLIVDVDRLKDINDAGGHAAGDRALRIIAQCLQATCRSRDFAARWGGDEFVVLAPGSTAREALSLAERIRSALRQSAAVELGAEDALTVSIGIADLSSAFSRRPEGLFEAADRALYEAKTSGRDRAIAAPPSPRRLAS